MSSTVTEQLEANAIVEWVLGVEVGPAPIRNNGGLPLFDREGLLGTLEVRSVRTPRRPGEPSPLLAAPRLTRSWLMFHPPSALVLARLSTVVAILADLEAAGATAIGAGAATGHHRAAVRSLAHFGVTRAISLDEEEGEGRIGFVPSSNWLAKGHSPSHLVNDVVEDEAWAEPAFRRPVDHGGLRHVFVWLDPADLEVRAAMEADTPPAPPIRPGGVDCLWVARRAPRRTGLVADRLWQTGTDGGWETLGPARRMIRPLVGLLTRM